MDDEWFEAQTCIVHDHPQERVSAVLGPDGEPLVVPVPRRAIGFDLRPKPTKGATKMRPSY